MKNMDKPKFKVGDQWKRRDGEVVRVDYIDNLGDYPICAGGHYYYASGKSCISLDAVDLIEKVAENTIAKFQRIVFEIDASPSATDEMEVRFPLAELVAVAHELADYEKFVADLNESLKDGDEKRRMIQERIDGLLNAFPQSSD